LKNGPLLRRLRRRSLPVAVAKERVIADGHRVRARDGRRDVEVDGSEVSVRQDGRRTGFGHWHQAAEHGGCDQQDLAHESLPVTSALSARP
jgi:hypothetical protein